MRFLKRIIAWIDRIAAFFTQQEESRSSNDPFDNEANVNTGTWLLLFLCGMAVASAFLSFGLALFWTALTVLYLATCLHEIKDPDVAYLFRCGRMTGRLKAGWYLVIPHFWEVRVVEREVIKRIYRNVKMLIKDRTYVSFDVLEVYQAGGTKQELKRALELREEDREDLFCELALSHLRTKIGERNIDEIITQQTTIENETLKSLQGEFRKYGYRLIDIEMSNIVEAVFSEAEKIRKLGQARGDEARAIAEPFKDNWPAVIASLGHAYFQSDKSGKGKILSKKSAETAGKKAGGVVEKAKQAVEGIKEFAENITKGGEE